MNSKRTFNQFAATLVIIATFCATLAHAQQGSERYSDGKLKWTARTSLSVRYPMAIPPDVSRSPDGKHFFVVTQQPDFDCNCTNVEVTFYSVEAVISAIEKGGPPPAPLRTFSLQGKNKRRLFQDSRWLSLTQIAFLGRFDVMAPPEVYTYDITTGRHEKLASYSEERPDVSHNRFELYGVDGFTTEGGSLIYSTTGAVKKRDDRTFVRGTLTNLQKLSSSSPDTEDVHKSYVHYRGGKTWEFGRGLGSFLRISPDGRFAVTFRGVREAPASWSAYESTTAEERSAADEAQSVEYVLIDLEREKETSLVNAPFGTYVRAGLGLGLSLSAFWSADAKQVVLINTALPTEGKPEYRSMSYIVAYDVASKKTTTLAPVRFPDGIVVADADWLTPGKELLVRRKKNKQPSSGLVFSYANGGWTSREVDASVGYPAKAAPADGLSIAIREDANTPPAFVAKRGGKEIALTAQDPSLANVWMAPTEAFKWKDKNGITTTAGLVLPREMPKDGSRIPLVIQSYDFKPGKFNPDGTSPADAAQAMAAQGIAVLQLDPDTVIDATGNDAPKKRRYFRDLVDEVVIDLTNKYPIDISKVGMIGFSFLGNMTRTLVTHPNRVRLAAAEVASSATQTYGSYLSAYALGRSTIGAVEATYGGNFYDAKSSWMERDLLFNVDKVHTPILFTRNGCQASEDLETIGAFKAAKRPFDFLFFCEGAHELVRPKSREANMEVTTDWFVFWLHGRERDPERKAEQYKVWREQKKLYDANIQKYGLKPGLIERPAGTKVVYEP